MRDLWRPILLGFIIGAALLVATQSLNGGPSGDNPARVIGYYFGGGFIGALVGGAIGLARRKR
jgi:hypothetical protein